MASPELTANLPEDHILVHFTNLENLEHTAERVHDSLNEKGDGNQFILVLGLTKEAIIKLDSEERALNGIPYRFMWDNTAGIIKVLTYGHDMVTLNMTRQLDRLCVAMGVDDPVLEFVSGGTTTRILCAGSKGKQPDGCVFPKSRLRRDRESWPTLVIEAGLPASLPRLREEARWWLCNSEGEVRIALALATHRQSRKLITEKWEQQKRAPIQQLSRQPQASLQAHATQTIEISPESESASGAALVLPFEELFDRPRQGKETDIVLTEERLLDSMRLVWELFT
ncbi:hypothetical protein CNMCM5793_000595 [Aspergillus hiratsukae]|uniref:Uncharacterized protein n=1 Tax=Aspergillus hiratsukae TaxID=1194566 RepID=A0A8H6QCB6_9EURO|nr:hypothetical protein CNMCM5793_000595 [Aspergillus hiratsukae]KAF7169757.1 hypothetical protein CNMCM6106_004547 [Aspergillus hiratsukae]